MAAKPRVLRVRERIRDELASAITTRLSDPRLAGVWVTSVDIDDGLELATVRVRHTSTDAAKPKEILKGLESAKPRLRTIVAASLGIRKAPDLRFRWDDGLEKALRVETLLEEISREPRAK
ncbi:MAG: 30S ribosome-binding factor RbfA [Polyangiaceae bacterium]|nr:30S ribosome-binding factor RbfA [Polyangiaceae bacterium]